ncbi:hypothetical protein J31TS4_00750 [Paenibacillus sp. J31TS4]|uniref:hypothetical protein n=1 Tax=Paenibacillus sp. J31TS4 TaxID=2807195 RepID=UPI001B2984B2|nr:hypothetical protein [Paenibacillus sp. J31TS4]GIP36795.1 hypothetical protein J31TS4_00750 [Paenibacillus sp. J31TS4]
MEDKPYYCPNCRSNRVKFSLISRTSQSFDKDAVTGSILETDEPVAMQAAEPDIECRVCGFVGNEQRFVRQAEREPRTPTL